MKHHPETNNRYYKLWLKYELLSYLIFFILSYGNWFNVKKNREWILYSLFLSPYPTRNKFNESVELKF